MCSVSAVFDYGRRIPTEKWTGDSLEAFKRIIKQAEQFDEIADQPDCEDPEKSKWLKEVEDRLTRIEKKMGINES